MTNQEKIEFVKKEMARVAEVDPCDDRLWDLGKILADLEDN